MKKQPNGTLKNELLWFVRRNSEEIANTLVPCYEALDWRVTTKDGPAIPSAQHIQETLSMLVKDVIREPGAYARTMGLVVGYDGDGDAFIAFEKRWTNYEDGSIGEDAHSSDDMPDDPEAHSNERAEEMP